VAKLLRMEAREHLSTITLTLASGSPRRRELLPLLGIPFVVQPVDVDENKQAGEEPAAMAVRLSQVKAQAGSSAAPSVLVVAADTLVALDGRVLGKPKDAREAVAMLKALRGRRHTVFSGVTLIDRSSQYQRSELARTDVWMRPYSDLEIQSYVDSGDPLDKAGAYAIQYDGFCPVQTVDGCYANVMGLPLCHLYRLLLAAGHAPGAAPELACNRHNHRVCSVAAAILHEGRLP
jgi:septum formation protein